MKHTSRTLVRVRRSLAAVAAGGLLLAATPLLSREVLDPAQVRKVAAQPAYREMHAQIASAKTPGAIVELISRTLGDAQLGKAGRELLLDHALHQLAQQPPTAAAQALVEGLQQRPVELYGVVDPDQSASGVPIVDAGATARFVLRRWEQLAARDDALAALQAKASWPLERFAGLSAASSRGPDANPQRTGILEAFDTLTPSQLQVHRDAIAAALQGGQRVDEIALRTAARLRDADLLEQVIGYAAPAIALDGIRQATQLHRDTVALEILGTAARRDEVASAALLQIGSIAARNDSARRLLLVALDDPANSASAAAALASLHDPSVALQLGQQLSATSNDTTRRQRVLALKLDGSAEARAQLDRFLRAGKGSAQLQKEVRQWLAH